MSIFVSIASYRDPELIPTLLDCIRRARFPADLHFGICWQHADGEPALPDLAPAELRLIKVPWQESRGACWARAEIMKLWNGEEFFLQLDSHHRFVQDWDAILIDQAARSGATRPLLSTYPPNYDPDLPLPPSDTPTYLRFGCFTDEANILYGKFAIDDWRVRTAPMRARFLGAGMLFTLGSFVNDVPYDPDLYFNGEEVTLAVRAFTHGYSLYHPSVHVLWHQDSPRLRARHWDDHVAAHDIAITGSERDAASLNKVSQFFHAPETGRFGCGTARSFAEYEAYAGVNFRRRFASPAARRGDEPPPAPIPQSELRTWLVHIKLDRAAISQAAIDRPQFWYVGVHDADHVEILRQDADHREVRHALSRSDGPIVIEREVHAPRPPASWTVWPVDRRGRWLEALSGSVEARCLD